MVRKAHVSVCFLFDSGLTSVARRPIPNSTSSRLRYEIHHPLSPRARSVGSVLTAVLGPRCSTRKQVNCFL